MIGMHDLRGALRALVRDPWFSLVLVLPLALGIGVNAGLIGLVDTLLLRPLPGITADRLFWVSGIERSESRRLGLAYPELSDLREAGPFESVAAFRSMAFNLGGGREAERAAGQAVTANYFDTLGVRPGAGRWFRAEEDRPSAATVAVIGHDLWQRRYGGSLSAIGQAIVVNNLECTIVGVTPRGFVGVTMADHPPQVFVPAGLLASMPAERELLGLREHAVFEGFGRLQAGTSARSASSFLRDLAARLEASGAGGRSLDGFALTPMHGSSHPADRGDVTRLAVVAFAISGIVLLVACANVAALLLGRSTTRAREIGIRLALGAGRGRVVRQLLIEGLLVAVFAGLLALVLAWWTVGALVAWLDVPFALGAAPDLVTLAATLGVSGVAAVLFGLVPALHATRGGIAAGGLGGGSAAGATKSRARLQRLSAVSQIALSLALLAAAGVLLRSARAGVVTADADADASRVITASIDLAAQGYPAARQQAFADELLERVGALPGVESCSLAMMAPGRGVMYRTAFGGSGEAAAGRAPLVRVDWVGPGYFRTMGMAMVRGRDLAASDTPGSPEVAVVNEALARSWWPGEDPLGKQLRFTPSDAVAHTVVGVVRDRRDLAGARRGPAVFFPHRQLADDRRPWTLLARTAGPAGALGAGLRQVVRRMDASVPLYEVATLRQIEGEHLRSREAASRAVNLLGGVALLLAAIGVYGLVSWRTARRQREIGVRMALGATRLDVLRLVASDGGRVAASGTVIGLALGAAAARVMAGVSGGSPAADVPMLLAVTGIVWLVVFAASCLPARRATRVNPSEVLRAE